jgi:aldehyde dehydrogenase (NAD+)
MSSPASLPDASLDYTNLVAAQRAYFLSGATRPVAWRRAQLEALKALLKDNRGRFYSALYKDLRRNEVDADLMDIGHYINEADYALKHMESWLKPEHLPMPLVLEPGRIRVRHDPLGVTLIIGPWNEPLMLTFGPLAPALAAGNTAVIKPSELAVATSALIAELVPRYLDREAVAVVEGAVPETTALLEQLCGQHGAVSGLCLLPRRARPGAPPVPSPTELPAYP